MTVVLIQEKEETLKETRRKKGHEHTEIQQWEQATRRQAVMCMPRREASEEPNPASTLISQTSSLQSCEKTTFSCLVHLAMIFCYGRSSKLRHRTSEVKI